VRSEREEIAALPFASRREHVIVPRNIDDVNQFGAKSLAGTPRGPIVGVAGYPELLKPVPTGEW
jgi:hypothetical protein